MRARCTLASLLQVTVKPTCPFVGSYLRDVNFTETFDASVLAVKRTGNRK